jgi:hypothetical protein
MSEAQQPKLCSVCCNQDLAIALTPPVDVSRPLAKWQGWHIIDFHKVCILCAFLFDVLNIGDLVPAHDEDTAPWRDELIYMYAALKDGEPGYRIEVHIGNLDMVLPVTLIHSRPASERLNSTLLLPGASTQASIPISGRPLHRRVPWSLARSWINHCASQHAHDQPLSEPHGERQFNVQAWASRFRLIDVRDKCVVEAKMSLPYVALSYVWGGSEPVRLVQRNMRELMTGGGLDRLIYLPKTFRDAIHVTQKLGMLYLWIDALCIQHDDDADRNHQINGMDQIYREASITIVSVTPNADCEMPGVRLNTRSTTSLRCKAGGVDLVIGRPSLATSIAQSDWESRGWTLQEKFFSKRLLYFTKDQVFFRCANATWAEDAVLEPLEFRGHTHTAVVLSHTNHQPRWVSHPPDLHAPRFLELFLEYQDLLQQYMKRNLTRDTDILAAFSGILNSFESSLGKSVYGLPELIFDASLLWYGHPSSKRRPGYPSWSWCGWKPEKSREISWLVMADTEEEDRAWVEPCKSPRSMSIDHIVIAMPQPLRSIRHDSDSQILQFQCNTFFDETYLNGDAINALQARYGTKTRPSQSQLDFLIMSGSRVNDTWFKRRNGTYALPPAPRMDSDFSASVNVMLVKTDERGISERIWVFNVVITGRLPDTVRKVIYLA